VRLYLSAREEGGASLCVASVKGGPCELGRGAVGCVAVAVTFRNGAAAGRRLGYGRGGSVDGRSVSSADVHGRATIVQSVVAQVISGATSWA
jgi:hypothetical protein